MDANFFVHSAPDWVGQEPGWPVGLPNPDHSFGAPVAWEPDYAPPAVFIGQTSLPGRGPVFLFGRKIDLTKRADQPVDRGFFVDYIVVDRGPGLPGTTHVLAQRRSVTYQAGEDVRDSIAAADLKKKEREALVLGPGTPRWKASDAQWPLVEGVPMNFVDQFDLPENDVTRTWLTFNERVFLFWRETPCGSVFKITTQEIRYQSADDHYREEARRARRSSGP